MLPRPLILDVSEVQAAYDLMTIISQAGSPQALLLTLLALMTTSCSSGALKTYPVEGHVVYDDGSPVKGGTVDFETVVGETADGQPRRVYANGAIDADGTFRLLTNREQEGVVAGVHRVAIGETPETGSDFDVMQASRRKKPTVLPKYANYDTSGLEVTVEPKSNAITITIKRP
ncbi:MAG: hypothetical protein WD468_09850 [Pirellulales bacterium]